MDAAQFRKKLHRDLDKVLDDSEFEDAEQSYTDFWEAVRDHLNEIVEDEDNDDDID